MPDVKEYTTMTKTTRFDNTRKYFSVKTLTLTLLLILATLTPSLARDISNEQKIAGLYVSFFNRAPDLSGLTYWKGRTQQAELQGKNPIEVFKEIALGFSYHPVFTSTYNSLNNEEFVKAIYINALGREGDSEGISYWTTELTNGLSRPDMVAIFVNASLTVDLTPQNFPTLSQSELDAAKLRQDLITNKTQVALEFINQLKDKTNVINLNDIENDSSYKASIKVISKVGIDQESVDNAIKTIQEHASDENVIDLINNQWDELVGVDNNTPTEISGQATLGPLSGSDIVLMDLNNTMIASSAAKSDDTDLNIAGSFSFSVKKSKLPDTFLLVAGGGKDIDPSDDGAISNSVDNNGSIHAILTIDDLQLKGLKINPLTEVVYQDALNTYGNGLASLSKSDLKVFLDKEAKTYLTDANATYSDILTFNPRVDKAKSKIAWSKVLSLVVSGVHDGESTGTINQRVASLKAWLKNEGVYTDDKNTEIKQISSNGNGNRIVTTVTKGEDNSSIGTINQILTTSSGEIINIYASKVNDTESYLRATVTKQGHEFSIEGKTTLLQGLSFDANTISNFVGSLITVTDSNATAIQITIDKQLTNKISDHEVVLKIDGRKPTADELQTISDDPITAWSWTTTKQISGAALIKNYPIQNQNDTSITILKNGLTAIDIPKYRYDQISGIQSERLKILKKGISNLIFDAVTSIPVPEANILSLIVSDYSVASDLEFVVVDGIVTAIEGTPLVNTSRVALIGKFDNSNPDEPNRIIVGEEYYPVILIRAGNNKDKKTNNLIFSVHYRYDKSQYYNLGTITLKSNRGYIIIPNKTVSFTNKGAVSVAQDLVFRVESSKGLLMSRGSTYKVSIQGLLTIPTYYNTKTIGDTLWLWGDVLSIYPSPLLNYSWENDGHVIGTSKDMTINLKNLKIDSYGNTKITLNVLGPSGEKGTKTKIISLCGANEIYKNGTCVSTNTKPTVIITDTQNGTATTTDPITFTFTWSEDVSEFDSSDIIVNGGIKGTFTAVSDSIYTLVVTPNSNATNPITIDIPANSATDIFQNSNDAIAQYIQNIDTVVVDTATPTSLTIEGPTGVSVSDGTSDYLEIFHSDVKGAAYYKYSIYKDSKYLFTLLPKSKVGKIHKIPFSFSSSFKKDSLYHVQVEACNANDICNSDGISLFDDISALLYSHSGELDSGYFKGAVVSAPPSVPQNISIEQIPNEGGLLVKWDAVYKATGYNVYINSNKKAIDLSGYHFLGYQSEKNPWQVTIPEINIPINGYYPEGNTITVWIRAKNKNGMSGNSMPAHAKQGTFPAKNICSNISEWKDKYKFGIVPLGNGYIQSYHSVPNLSSSYSDKVAISWDDIGANQYLVYQVSPLQGTSSNPRHLNFIGITDHNYFYVKNLQPSNTYQFVIDPACGSKDLHLDLFVTTSSESTVHCSKDQKNVNGECIFKTCQDDNYNCPTTNIKDYLIFDGEHGYWQLRLDSDNSKVSIIRINNEIFDNKGYISANNIFYDDFGRASTIGLEIVNIDNKSFTLKYFDTLDKTTVLKQNCSILSSSSFKCENSSTFYKSNSQEYENAVIH